MMAIRLPKFDDQYVENQFIWLQRPLFWWKKGRDLEPDNWVVRKQIWAVEHPERFYDGDVDSAWQKEQIQQGT